MNKYQASWMTFCQSKAMLPNTIECVLYKTFCFSSEWFIETWWSCSTHRVNQHHQVLSNSDGKQKKKICVYITLLMDILSIKGMWIRRIVSHKNTFSNFLLMFFLVLSLAFVNCDSFISIFNLKTDHFFLVYVIPCLINLEFK